MALAFAFVLAGGVASAQTPTQMSGYQFQAQTGGSLTDMSGGSQIISAGLDDTRSSLQTLPFTFNFGGNNYSNFSVSSNGLLAFGTTLVSTTTTASTSTSPYPWITPKANDQITRGAGVVYKVIGTSPNRIAVVQWDTYRYSTSTSTTLYEARLYETTNEVQFVYGASASATNWTGYIGMVAASSNYLLVNSNTNTAQSTSVPSGMTTMPPAGTVYRFFACSQNVSIAGNTSQGAQSAALNNGESIFASISVQRGNSASYTPFTLTNPSNACGTRTFSYSITGAAAGDYAISTTGGTLAAGATNTPTITFTPMGTGTRTAILTVTDNGSPQFARTYALSASGTPRFIVSGNLAQGGTANMASGDTLMRSIILFHGTCASFTPFTLSNTNTNPSSTVLTYSASIDSAGLTSTQYTITGGASGTLSPGGTVTPTILFCPSRVNTGPQTARLTVTTSDGDVRIYTLFAIAGAPTIGISVNGAPYNMGDQPLFKNQTTCAGEQAASLPFVITNTGIGELLVNEFVAYRLDTTIQQGIPQLALARDANGRLIPEPGYVLSTQPGIAPAIANPVAQMPISILAGQSRTLYLTYVGPEPGRRYARAYLRTTGENVFGVDTNLTGPSIPATTTQGLFVFDVVGRSVGSQLAADVIGSKLETMQFPAIDVGDTVTRSFSIANSGACDLRISRNALRIYSGDVNEFTLMSVLANARVDAATNDYVLAPGQSDSIVVRFIPSRSGTRMATVRLKTNDSTINRPGLVERGTWLFDIQGRGRAGLDSRELVLAPVVIGSSVNGAVVVENSSNSAVEIASIGFIGGDAAEFVEDGVAPWPARPFMVLPGAKLALGVRLTPIGDPGVRRTQMVLVTTGGDSIHVNVRGEAGTQTLVLSATSLFDDVSVPVGSVVRRMLMISNTGTLPIRLLPPSLSGADSASYRLGLMPRLDLEPGATEYLEVTFVPQTQGQASAELTISPVNGTPQTVTLGGTALKVYDPTKDVSTRPIDIGPVGRGGARTGDTERAPVTVPAPAIR